VSPIPEEYEMNKIKAGLAPLILLLACSGAWAQDDSDVEAAPRAKADKASAVAAASAAHEAAVVARAETAVAREKAFQAQTEAATAYREALQAAEKDQRAALEAVEAARKGLQAREVQEFEQEKSAELELHTRELEEVQRELERAHDSLRRASREVARVHRQINRPQPVLAPHYNVEFFHEDRAVIGVILGESDKGGVPVLGVSPDGPAERAGMTQGDVIVSIMGTPLADGDEDARAVLSEVMKEVKVGDELAIAVDRGGERREFTIVPEAREPFTWHSYSRLPSVSTSVSADGAVIIKQIEVPEIDRESLDREMTRLRGQLDETRIVINSRRAPRDHPNAGDHLRSEEDIEYSDGDYVYEYEFDTEAFSGFGDAVLAGTNVWFGMPLVRGLKMAEVGEGLGEYFKTDRGVLVLKARENNELQLRSGDVILSVDDIEVNKPADFMRALRNVESGMELDIEIKRDRKSKTLVVEVPENRYGFNFLIHGGLD